MPDILIHRCTLRVVRRGGWNWGPEPKRMLQNVMRQVPELLAQKLEQLLPEDEDRDFSAPIQIRIPIRLGELAAMTGKPAATERPSSLASLEAKLDLSLRRIFGLERTIEIEPNQRERFPLSIPVAADGRPAGDLQSAGAIARLLQQWFAAEILEEQLAAFSPSEIEVWHRTVLRRSNSEADTPPADPTIEEHIHALFTAKKASLPKDKRDSRLRLRIMIAASAAAKFRIPLDSTNLLTALDHVLPSEETETSLIDEKTVPLQEKTADRRSRVAHRAATGDVHVDCALPFLLLGPLSRLGYLDGVGAVLEAAELSDAAPLFAEALAYKVLDAPERAWRRTPSSLGAASAFAGLEDPVPNESLVEFSRRMTPHAGPLERLLMDSMIRGHAPGDPVTLRRADLEGSTGFMLIGANGCFPIAWVEELQQLVPILHTLGGPVILVSREAAGPRVLRLLDENRFSFVSDVPPTRDERWRRIQQGPALLGWANHEFPESELVLRGAREFGAASEEAAAFWETLAVATPGVIHEHGSRLDRTLTLAAGVACGMISWKLWRNRGRTTPQMAVERFCDLDGWVRFDSETITVRLPLGRRHRELLENGLLNPVGQIPWFGKRRVEFGGG